MVIVVNILVVGIDAHLQEKQRLFFSLVTVFFWVDFLSSLLEQLTFFFTFFSDFSDISVFYFFFFDKVRFFLTRNNQCVHALIYVL